MFSLRKIIILLLTNLINLFILLLSSKAGIFMEIWESIDDEIPVITYHYCDNDIWKIEDTKGVITIIDLKKNIFSVIYPKEKIYALSDLSEIIEDMQRALEKNMLKDKKANKVKEGIFKKKFIKKEIINNIECEHYIIYESGEKLEELWFTNDSKLKPIKDIFQKLKVLSKPAAKIRNFLKDEEEIEEITSGLGFPIKVKTYTSSGIVLSEVKYYQEKEFSEEEFAIPEAYERISLMEIYMRAYGKE